MSRGSLDYFYSRIDEPIQIISEKIKWGKKSWSSKTLRKFNMAIKYLRVAQIYSKRIEWLLSGDEKTKCAGNYIRKQSFVYPISCHLPYTDHNNIVN